MNSQEFNFTVDSALLGELGERLVPADYIALSELVKNSYDADAPFVRVEIKKEENSIRYVIADEGTGMTFKEVQDFWMKIGTTNKQKEDRSRIYGRVRTGAKGVGRFSVRRLGPNLKLITTALNKDGDLEKTTVIFNWDDFKAGSDVSQIKCEGKTELIPEGRTGTTLIISGKKKDILNQQGFKTLRRQLLKLSSYAPNKRIGKIEDPGFEIQILAPDFESENEPIGIRDRLFDAGWAELKGKTDNEGYAKYELDSDFTGEIDYSRETKFEGLKNVEFRISIIPSDKKQLRKPDLLAKYVINEIKQDWGGVYVRFNGFRVYPYGDPGDDWLNLAKDTSRRLAKSEYSEIVNFAQRYSDSIEPSRMMLNLLTASSYIGYVDVTTKSGLEPKLDRQGFLEDTAFTELVKFIRIGIDWSTLHRDRFIQKRETEKREEQTKELEKALNLNLSNPVETNNQALSFIDSTVESLTEDLPKETKKETRSKVEKSISAVKAIFNERDNQLRHLRLLSSTSTTTLLFAHEVRTLLTTLVELRSRVNALIPKLGEQERNEISSINDLVQTSQTNLKGLLDYTFSILPSRKEESRKKLHLREQIEEIVSMFNPVIKNYGVEVDFESEIPNNIQIGPLQKIELQAPIINVYANSLKAVIANKKPRKILFSATKNDGFATLIISDTGIGIKKSNYEKAFELFESDPEGNFYKNLSKKATDEDLMLLGQGTGIGLSIARDILRSVGGDIEFVTPQNKWSTSVKVKLPIP